jgi:hypothetical protein
MRKIALWALYLGATGLLLLQLSRAESANWRLFLGVVAGATNLLCGIRLGCAAGMAYFQDVVRLNQYLSDQNGELIQANRELLERFSVKDTTATPYRSKEQRA